MPVTDLKASWVNGKLVFTDNAGNTVATIGADGVQAAVEAGSTAADFASHGLTYFGATAAKNYYMDPPVAGTVKHLLCTAGSTAALQTVRGSTDNSVTIGSTAAFAAAFNAALDALVLIGRSATHWDIVSNVGSVAATT